jgi:hypothetical protein
MEMMKMMALDGVWCQWRVEGGGDRGGKKQKVVDNPNKYL